MQFLIIANGPFLPKAMIQEAAIGRHIIALDGACDKAADMGVFPHVILGDLDSIRESGVDFWGIKDTFAQMSEKAEAYMGNHGVKIVPIKNQDLTDLAKAIRYCDQNGATAIDVVCIVGGTRMDHTLSNISILRSEYHPKRQIRLITECNMLFFAKNETVEIRGEVNDYCGIMPAPTGRFTSEGLRYEGKNYELDFGFRESTSNQLNKPVANIEIIGEAIIVHPPVLNSQRDFCAQLQV